jgi:hypothetical protein
MDRVSGADIEIEAKSLAVLMFAPGARLLPLCAAYACVRRRFGI